MKKLLLIEDEEVLAEVILDNLNAEGYDVTWAPDGAQGMERWKQSQFDLVLLDVMLPHIDGFHLCETMRQAGEKTPVLFLSAKGQPEDRVKGLSLGGDDYLTKPFHLPELLLRIQNLLQRHTHPQEASDPIIRIHEHRVDRRNGQALLADGRYVQLSDEEMRLLNLFLQSPNQILDRETILDQVWGDDVFPSSRAIERLVQRLQHIFEPNPYKPVHFHQLAGIRFQYTPKT